MLNLRVFLSLVSFLCTEPVAPMPAPIFVPVCIRVPSLSPLSLASEELAIFKLDRLSLLEAADCELKVECEDPRLDLLVPLRSEARVADLDVHVDVVDSDL